MQIKELMEKALESGAPEGLQPTVLMHLNVDFTKVIGFKQVHAGLYNEIEELFKADWTLFRVQTELNINGHGTVAYFVKMKS